MSTWMKRRIERSRARCQQRAAAHKDRGRPPKSKPRADRRAADSTPHTVALWRAPESQVV